MSENKKTWDERITLALSELENKINAENAVDTKMHRSRKKKNQTKAQWKREAFRQEIIMQVVKSAAFLLATLALIQGIVKVLPDSITVSNSVNGRELPIYCVETDKNQIALSFDAAWGNEDTAKILEILRKHNVKVTFFMTGGWVTR